MATLLLKPELVAKPKLAPLPAPIEPRSRAEDRFALERGLALMLVAVAAIYLRARDPLYNTAYMDESVYVVYGRMFLAHHFEAPLDTPLQWSFGWYLWPAMAALADRIGGLLALRELAAALGTITVAATYGFASRVFSKTVGLGAAAVMAVLAPAVLVSRIATRDSGSVCFFALGLWAFAAGWQENKKRHWIMATLFFFSAFLCKYLVAIFFPALVLLALWKGKKPFLLFLLPLSAACAAYAALHWADLLHLLRYGSGYGSLRADAFSLYVAGRWDLALIAWLAVLAFAARGWRIRAAWMWLGALIVLVFQWKTRADYDFWKHVNYALLFLVPAAVAGLLSLIRQMLRRNYLMQMQWGTVAVLALALGAGWLGKVQSFGQFVFWPNVSPVLAFFENRITPQDTVLVDDTVFRYYFNPPLHQPQIADPMYFHYRDSAGNDLFGEQAYRAAVADRAFTQIILDGGMGEEARKLDAAIRPQLAGYQLQMRAVDPVRGHDIEIYSRDAAFTTPPASDPAAPSIQVLWPPTDATVNGATTVANGIVTGAQPGWYVRLEVFTNRWYPQGEAVPVLSDGSFRQAIYLGGNGRQQCFHLVRARLVDEAGHSRAVALNHGIARDDGKETCSASASASSGSDQGN
jgi:dolichyl-phosphate-mannose-protein mannosyltransferase